MNRLYRWLSERWPWKCRCHMVDGVDRSGRILSFYHCPCSEESTDALVAWTSAHGVVAIIGARGLGEERS
jgi:hypothetical protein